MLLQGECVMCVMTLTPLESRLALRHVRRHGYIKIALCEAGMFSISLYMLTPFEHSQKDLRPEPILSAEIHEQLTLLQHACLCRSLRSSQQVLCTFNPKTSPWCNWHTGMRFINPHTIKPGQLHTDCMVSYCYSYCVCTSGMTIKSVPEMQACQE